MILRWIPYLLGLLLYADSLSSQSLKGSRIPCDNEGEDVHISRISEHPCINCKCEKGFVDCRRDMCHLPKGCYFLQAAPKGTCCDICKGCFHNGNYYNSSTKWHDPQDPCTQYSCQSGIITKTKMFCQANCKNPIPPKPGTCCSSCPSCTVDGVEYKEGDIVPSEERDICLKCICKDGNVVCSKAGCPVLPCSHTHLTHTLGDCCPECRGTKRLRNLPGMCLIGHETLKDGEHVLFDECTECKCENGTAICLRQVCPPLPCPQEHAVRRPGECCGVCRGPETKKAICLSKGRMRLHGDIWRLDKCTKCSCHHGEVRCAAEQCVENPACPPRQKLVTQPGDCCPTCVEEDGICRVFGDPHYKTFDGKLFNFQGHCRYTLAADCTSNTFSIEVWNDQRYSKMSSWTKAVAIRIGSVRVKLGQYNKVRVNKKRIKEFPHVDLGVLSINKEGNSIVVRANKEVKVTWNGNSFLEVSLSPRYKEKVCGLCGNYNYRPEDDFTGKKANLLNDSTAFGNSWLIGRRKRCIKPTLRKDFESDCKVQNPTIWMQNNRECNVLKSEIFHPCHKVVSHMPYLRACYMDTCECQPGERCYCDSFHAYARECERKGVRLEWKISTKCEGMHCPRGSFYSPCGPACRKTCKNYHKSRSCRRECRSGCHCVAGLVWHKDRCIMPSECPTNNVS